MLENGCDKYGDISNDSTILQEAINKGFTKVVEKFVEIKSVPLDVQRLEEICIFSIRYCSIKLCKSLFPLMDLTVNENMAIRFAVKKGCTEIVEMLLA
jgi:hypothetical protein